MNQGQVIVKQKYHLESALQQEQQQNIRSRIAHQQNLSTSRLFQVKKQRQYFIEGSRLTVAFLADEGAARNREICKRFYTLTHNDLNGDLYLSIGNRYNLEQLSGPWQQILRDEVLAWWEFMPAFSQLENHQTKVKKRPILHVECHVSGEQSWPLPLLVRDYVFQQEIPLVLNCILHGDAEFVNQRKVLDNSIVVVHLRSDKSSLDRQLIWGLLGQPQTWRQPPSMFELVTATTLDMLQIEGQNNWVEFD
eukprot:TRINITY_DN110538_c0_g1_i1.p1 TRINITY_DN110538_c0_g1~~TRINITY_DN110538_c0_g1_i1.p1  ORF type:complete len:250 (+),score=17.31 TRINITY_DN110538_c0_g1_i1:55-804(+)